MKLLYKIFIFTVIALSSCTETDDAAERQKVYFLNEDFTLVDRREISSYNADRHEPLTIRTWVIVRDNATADSVYVAELTVEKSQKNEKGKDFVITSDLWYNKKIGDKLHFDFIRKDRFFRVLKEFAPKPNANNSIPVTTISNPIEPSNVDFEKERHIMDLERQITDLQRELDRLKGQESESQH
jgi:hypothetical protein